MASRPHARSGRRLRAPPRCFSAGRWACAFLAGLAAAATTMIRPALAAVTVLSTGARYDSRQDRSVGKPLWRGYEYMAALQFLPGNMPLCPPRADDNNNSSSNGGSSNYPNVTIPDDGLPVALLVRSGMGCTLDQKIEFALTRIQPAGVVRYLLIDDADASGKKGGGPVPIGSDASIVATEEKGRSGVKIAGRTLVEVNTVAQRDGPPVPAIRKRAAAASSPLTVGSIGGTGNGDGRDGGGTSDVPLYVIYVSPRAQFELLDYLLKVDPAVTASGGPRISLDSRATDSWWDSEGAIYIALSALLSACACSFLLFAGGWGHPDDDLLHHAQPPPRPQRRRLTREQVRRMFPQWHFDGDDAPLRAVVSAPAVGDPPGKGHGGDRAAREEAVGLLSEAPGPEESAVGPTGDSPDDPLLPPQPVELSLCSICLDDYEAGDKLRVLPCNHAFHGKCIGKWLVERSATCPLCKTDLFDEEEEENEGRDEVEQVQEAPRTPPREYGANMWDRSWHRFFTTDAYQFLQQPLVQQDQNLPPLQTTGASTGTPRAALSASSPPLIPLGNAASVADRPSAPVRPSARSRTVTLFGRRFVLWPRQSEENSSIADSSSAMLSEPLLLSHHHQHESELRTLAPRSSSPSQLPTSSTDAGIRFDEGRRRRGNESAAASSTSSSRGEDPLAGATAAGDPLSVQQGAEAPATAAATATTPSPRQVSV